ncbi:hypothetical protein AB0A60_34975 [Streptomyces sp. NPDC046275]|uniref:hypothetical protein n=1 Tax=Streptomyces sp. NPDC046275 TaxID=3157201 RepID=UPI003404124B
MNTGAWPTNMSRHLPWRRRPIAAAARTIASWSAATRLQTRGHLLWPAQQITEARRAAQGALDHPDRSLATVPDTLDITLPPQVREAGPGGEQLALALRQARREAEQLATAAPRIIRRTLRRLAADLAEAEATFDRVCNDVRGADLRTADLTHLYLGGLRWDAATQWPDAWRERIRAASDPVDGIHQIRDH